MEERKTIENLIVISDLHSGCGLALCPPEGIQLDEGGIHLPSTLQINLWQHWRYFWDEWVPQLTHNEPFAVLFNGDAIDGRHHNTVTQFTQNLAIQAKCAETLLKPIVELCEGRFYFNRGTEAHIGPSGEQEEQIAKNLGAIPEKSGAYSRWISRLRIGDGLVHASHHISGGSSIAYETSAPARIFQQEYAECARWGREIPDCIVRSHRHRNIEIRARIKKGNVGGFATVFVTAGWQLATPLSWRLTGSGASFPQIGGSLIRWRHNNLYAWHMIWDIELPKIEEITL